MKLNRHGLISCLHPKPRPFLRLSLSRRCRISLARFCQPVIPAWEAKPRRHNFKAWLGFQSKFKDRLAKLVRPCLKRAEGGLVLYSQVGNLPRGRPAACSFSTKNKHRRPRPLTVIHRTLEITCLRKANTALASAYYCILFQLFKRPILR